MGLLIRRSIAIPVVLSAAVGLWLVTLSFSFCTYTTNVSQTGPVDVTGNCDTYFTYFLRSVFSPFNVPATSIIFDSYFSLVWIGAAFLGALLT